MNARAESFRKHGFRCYACGAAAYPGCQLVGHHQLTRRWFPELVDDPDCILPLCMPCHDVVHRAARFGRLIKLADLARRRPLTGLTLVGDVQTQLGFDMPAAND
jgi:hypothetical protein